jgi:hypothetical protein
MQKINWLVLCFLSITAMVCAQETHKDIPSAKPFELPPYSIHQTFRIDLGKENQLWLQLGADAGPGALEQYRLHFARIPQRYEGVPGLTLRSGHDQTDRLRGRPLRPEKDPHPPVPAPGPRYDRLSLYINQYGGLEGFINGSLNNKLHLLQQNVGSQYIGNDWTWRMGVNYLNADLSVSLERIRFAHAEEESRNSLLLNTTVRVDAQNSKNYFTPSFSLGLSFRLNVGEKQHAFSTSWEPFFFFTTDAQGHTQTSHNDFLVFSYIYGNAPRHADEKPVNLAFGIRPAFSLGYLVNREGAYFEKHSFRLSAARLNLYQDNIYLEPCMYFHDFFRGVTPGIRISVEGIF